MHTSLHCPQPLTFPDTGAAIGSGPGYREGWAALAVSNNSFLCPMFSKRDVALQLALTAPWRV